MNMKKSMAIILMIVCTLCIGGCSNDGDSSSAKEALAVNDITSSTSELSENSSVVSTQETVSGNDTTDYNGSNTDINTNINTTEIEMNNSTQTIVNNNNNNGQGGVNADPSFTVPANNGQNNLQNNNSGNGNNNGNNNMDIPIETVETVNGAMDISGKSETEWIAEAQELYKEGCDIAFRYLCTGSEFPFDRDNLEILDKAYFLTTCTSFEEATAPYYEIFSREYHGNDFDGLLVSQNGKLYAARSARGMDMTYLSSEVESLKSVSDKEIVFNVVIEYEDSETTAEFTLVPEDGIWKIGKFTLPY